MSHAYHPLVRPRHPRPTNHPHPTKPSASDQTIRCRPNHPCSLACDKSTACAHAPEAGRFAAPGRPRPAVRVRSLATARPPAPTQPPAPGWPPTPTRPLAPGWPPTPTRPLAPGWPPARLTFHSWSCAPIRFVWDMAYIRHSTHRPAPSSRVIAPLTNKHEQS